MKIKDFDFSNFVEYARMYHGDNCRNNQHGAEDLLVYWEQNKNKYLWDLMGHELIKSRRFSYSATSDDILQKMEDFVEHWGSFVDVFLDALYKSFEVTRYQDWFRRNTREDSLEYHERYTYLGTIARAINNSCILMTTRFEDSCSCTHPTNGKKYSITPGQKIMKVLGDLAQMLNMKDQFEQYRIAHSQVLNQKTITGELALSIHPLDYATASDNENGWTSCMSWQEEGCYRLGTVEMMNSPMVICAYVKSDTQEMVFGRHGTYYKWPSKKWRAWIIVDAENRQIFSNKHYPYQCQPIAAEAVNWVAALANENLGWNITTDADMMDHDPDEYELHYETNFMYNDFNYQRNMHVGETALKLREHRHKGVNYSGPANCMCCGNYIDWTNEDDGASTLLCDECDGRHRCTCCGCLITNDDDCFYDENDDVYCEGCYRDRFSHCEDCDRDVISEEVYYHVIEMNHSKIEEKEKEFGLIRRGHTHELDRTSCVDCIKDNHCNAIYRFHHRVWTDNCRYYYLNDALDLSTMSAEDIWNAYNWRRFYINLEYHMTVKVEAFFNWLKDYLTNFYNKEVEAGNATLHHI